MKSIVILISGRGSNLRAIIEACAAEQWPARIAAVVSNRGQAEGLEIARQHGIVCEVIDERPFAERRAFDTALQECIDRFAPDLVAMAGFMRVLGDEFVHHYRNRLMNIHPSLLPAFPGLATHRRALDAGVRVHGATVHLVTPELDHGPIVAQGILTVQTEDTPSSLAKRVLAVEHRIYPMAIRWFIEGRLDFNDGRVRLDGQIESTLHCAL